MDYLIVFVLGVVACQIGPTVWAYWFPAAPKDDKKPDA